MIRVNYHGLFEDWRMDEMNAPIGVFDSGVGGLTVVKEIMRQLPAESLVYLGTRRECHMEVNHKKPFVNIVSRSYVFCRPNR